MGQFLVRNLTLCFLFVFSVFVWQGKGVAGLVPNSACDQDFLNLMNRKAEMSGQRDLEQAAAIILKSDSILQYSCFSDHIDDLGIDGGTVKDPMNKYLQQNFNYNAASGQSSVSKNCGMMAQVWQFSKCKNVYMATFPTFAELTSTDIRNLPAACGSYDSNHNSRWSNWVSEANPPVTTVMASVTSYMDDDMNMFHPVNCKDSQPIETGLIVFEVDDSGYNPQIVQRVDKVCPAPGCYYSVDPADWDAPGECKSSP